MAFESEAYWRAGIRDLGGLTVSTDAGEFVALFDDNYVEISGVEERGPALTAVSSDIRAAGLVKGGAVFVPAENGASTRTFRARSIVPGDNGVLSIVHLGA